MWWGAFLAGGIVWRVWSELGGDTAADLAGFVAAERASALVGVAGDVLYLVAAVILLRTVTHVTSLQDQVANRLVGPATSGAGSS